MRWLFGKKQAPPPISKADLDALTTHQLAKAGADLAKPTEIVNYLYLPDEARARQAGAELSQAGYRVQVRPAATGKDWLALATIDLVPSDENIEMLRSRFEAIASRLGGEYDGWEAAVTK
jgi:hypothetical protein